jgi:UMF1 family MFS transporter
MFMKHAPPDRAMKAWAMYDWANSAFSTTVMAGFAPILFKEYWSAGADASETSFRLGLTNSLASLFIAIMAPVLGAIADGGGRRKTFLLFFTIVGVVTTGMLVLPGRGVWEHAAIVYAIATVAFSACMIFYDALLMDVSTPGTADRVSARGFALGYLGGGLLFALNVLMTLKPHWFLLPDATAAARASFVTVAIWWALFSIPLFVHVREKPGYAEKGTVREGLLELADTFRHLRRHRNALLFLVGYWLYIDGVSTIVRMAVDYGISLGFPSSALIGALLLTQFVGFPASIWFGRIGEKFGARTGIFISIAVYIGICLWGYRLAHVWEFYALATAIGLVQGGINSLSRSLFARLSPHDRSAQFFGFYNMVGRFSAVLGPVLMGAVSARTGNPRLSMLALTTLFVAGALFLARVREQPLSSAQPQA